MQQIVPFIRKHKNLLLMAYLFLGIWICFKAYFGQYFFITTTYTYFTFAAILYLLLKISKVSINVFVLLFASLLSLFLAEFTIRYIARYHLSYGEQNNQGYCITYRYSKWENIRFIYLEGRKDIYTLQFDSGEARNYNTADFQYPTAYCNALGFRGVIPDKRKKIILALGDSFTEGAGAPNDSAYPVLLQSYIHTIDTSIDVLNAGVSGNDIFFDWQMVHKLEKKYHLKQLLFLMNTTDINEVAYRGGNDRFIDNGMLAYKAGPWWEPFYALSFVGRLFVNNVMKLDYNLQTAKEHNAATQKAIKDIASLVKDEIAPWSKRTGVEVIIALHPTQWELGNADSRTEYDSLLASLQRINGILVIDCLPEIKSKGVDQDLYWKHDQHFNAKGYNMIARYIYETCYQLVPPSRSMNP